MLFDGMLQQYLGYANDHVSLYRMFNKFCYEAFFLIYKSYNDLYYMMMKASSLGHVSAVSSCGVKDHYLIKMCEPHDQS